MNHTPGAGASLSNPGRPSMDDILSKPSMDQLQRDSQSRKLLAGINITSSALPPDVTSSASSTASAPSGQVAAAPAPAAGESIHVAVDPHRPANHHGVSLNMNSSGHPTSSNSGASTPLPPVATDSKGTHTLKTKGSLTKMAKTRSDYDLISIKHRGKLVENPTNKEKPKVHINMDVEVLSIDIASSLFTMSGFIRFVFPVNDKTKDLRIKTNAKKEYPITELRAGWSYDVRVLEDNQSILPVNMKFMFYNSAQEEIIYSDVFIEKSPERHVAVVNIRFRAIMQQEFDLSDFPFDRQYLGIKVNIRTQYNFIVNEDDIRELVPRNLGFMISPFTCRTSFSMVGFTQVAAFADLAPPDLSKAKDAKGTGEYQTSGKPLYYALIERESLFHYRSFVVPIALTMVSSLMILSTDPVEKDSFNDRNNLILALFLTLVSMKYILIQALPEGDQETILDEMMRIMFLLLFLITIETQIMHFIVVDSFNVDYAILGTEHSVRVLDAICIVIVFIYLFFLQLQFLLLRTRLTNVFIHLFCCRFSESVSSTSFCQATIHCGNHLRMYWKMLTCCKARRPYREVIRPWVEQEEMTAQLEKLQYQFIGREARNKLSVKCSDKARGIYEITENQLLDQI